MSGGWPSATGSAAKVYKPFNGSSFYSDTTTMRSFNLKDFLGVSLTTTVPGRLTISLPTSDARGSSCPRAQSEPIPRNHQDVEMDSPMARRGLPRSHSEYVIRIPSEGITPSNRHDVSRCHSTTIVLPECHSQTKTISIEQESQHPLRGPPSPAATDVDDPESQDIVADIQQRGVKIRDYAYLPPPQAVTEVFDQYKALTEIDYRWTQPQRTYPVAGKTLRRLLDIGWLSPAELYARAHSMDLEALQIHDARPKYPWRPLCMDNMKPLPGMEERRMMLDVRRGYWRYHDRILSSMEQDEARRRREAEEVMRARKSFEEIEKRRQEEGSMGAGWGLSPGGTKRRFEDDEDDEDAEDADDDPFTESSAKRRRLSPDTTNHSSFQLQQSQLHSYSQPCSQSHDAWPHYPAPAKQYPAPLRSYNPELYPDAASIIEASSQSQPRTMDYEREDTPPLESVEPTAAALRRTDTPPADSEQADGVGMSWSPGKQPLVHPRKNGMKRGLSRTQTFAQL